MKKKKFKIALWLMFCLSYSIDFVKPNEALALATAPELTCQEKVYSECNATAAGAALICATDPLSYSCYFWSGQAATICNPIYILNRITKCAIDHANNGVVSPPVFENDM